MAARKTKKDETQNTTETATTVKNDGEKIQPYRLELVEKIENLVTDNSDKFDGGGVKLQLAFDKLQSVLSGAAGKVTDAPNYSAALLTGGERGFSRSLVGDAHFTPFALADVFAASGLFGDKTPAQIAVQILAGGELGLSPVESMVDLRIEPGKVEYKAWSRESPSFRQVRNSIEKLENANKGDLSASNSKNDTLPAEPGTKASEAAKLASAPLICPACLKQKPTLEFTAIDNEDLAGVYFCSPGCALDASQNLRASKRNETTAKIIQFAELDPAAVETAFDKAENDPETIAAVADILHERILDNLEPPNFSGENEKSSLKDQLSKNPRNDVMPETDPATTPENPPEKVNIETDEREAGLQGKDAAEIQKHCRIWRVQLNDMLSDLGKSPDAITAKLKEYDGLLSWKDKLNKLKACEVFYAEKMKLIQKRIFDVLDDPAQFLSQPAARKEYLLENLLKPDLGKYDFQDFKMLEKSLLKDKILQPEQ